MFVDAMTLGCKQPRNCHVARAYQPYSAPQVIKIMSNRNFSMFKKSCLAVAVLSLTACSSTPNNGGFNAGRLGDNLASAGKGTVKAGVRVTKGAASLSASAIDGTAYWLGFGEDRPVNENLAANNNVPLDEVDLALLEEDAVLPTDELAEINPVTTETAELITNDSADLLTSDPFGGDADLLDTQESSEPITVSAGPEALPEADLVASADLVHEVGSNENLWTIAKRTTGDANNWHILADINNLAPDAAVHPGQLLTIPADMVRPDLNTQQAASDVVENQKLPAESADTAILALDETTPATPRLKVPEENTVAAASAITDGRTFELESGETLWDFSKRTTGDATNWKQIAAMNGFTDEQAVKVYAGQKIVIAENLVRPELSGATPVPAATDETVVTAEIDEVAADASAAVLAGNNLSDETQPIKIVEAAFKSDSPAAPLTEDTLAENAEETLDDGTRPSQIMVSGTYYPKAIYNNADFSSSLLMRVSPGTTLQVSRAMGSWFEVETNQGIGYVHQRDVK